VEIVGAVIASLAGLILEAEGTAATEAELEARVRRIATMIREQIKQQKGEPMATDKEGTPLSQKSSLGKGPAFQWHPSGTVSHPEFPEMRDIHKRTHENPGPPVSECLKVPDLETHD
jgi:hypothetical protein